MCVVYVLDTCVVYQRCCGESSESVRLVPRGRGEKRETSGVLVIDC